MGHSSMQGAGSAEALLGHSCMWIPVEEREASDSLSARQKLGHPASSHRQAAVAAEPEGMPRPWVRKLRWGRPGDHNNVTSKARGGVCTPETPGNQASALNFTRGRSTQQGKGPQREGLRCPPCLWTHTAETKVP